MMGVKRIKNVTNNDCTNEGAFKIDEKKYKKVWIFAFAPPPFMEYVYTFVF